jgi:hypothetical protein
MNYTIFTPPQITPATVVRNDIQGAEVIRENPEQIVLPAYTNIIYRPSGYDRFSADPAKRSLLLADPGGVATRDEILAAFPGWLDSLMDAVRAECQRHILATYPIWYQSNVALGIYGTPVADKLRNDIAAVITESNRCEQLIYDGQAYTLNPPVIGG